MSIRPLTPELQAKAIAELNEDPKRIPQDIQHIKDWLAKQPHLRARTDDQFILTFLRGCKFSLERTKEKLETYYTMRSLLPEFFKNRDPFDPKIQELLKQGMFLYLSKPPGPDAPMVSIFRIGAWDTAKHSMEDTMKLNLMLMDILTMEDDHRLIAGMITLNDGTGLNMSHLTHMNPSVMKKGSMFFQDAMPNRPKAMHMFNPPSFIEAMMGMVMPFMKEKLKKRIHIHNTKNIDDMYQYFPKSVLPTEYGGEAGSMQDEIDYWKKKVESYAEWFKEDEAKYGCDESKRPGKPKTATDLFGIEGSFRKLDVD